MNLRLVVKNLTHLDMFPILVLLINHVKKITMPHNLRLLFFWALVKLTLPNGVGHIFLALAYSGSQSCFLTENTALTLCTL